MENAPAGIIFNIFEYGSQSLRRENLPLTNRSAAEKTPKSRITGPVRTPMALEQREGYEAFYAGTEKVRKYLQRQAKTNDGIASSEGRRIAEKD